MKYLVLISFLLISFVLFACSNDGSKSTKVSSASKSTLVKTANNKDKAVVSSEEVQDQTDPMTKEQLAKAKAIIKEAGNVNDLDAKKLYKRQCTTCHGLKGNLKINGAKDLTKSTIDLENAVAQVYFGKGLMMPYKQMLSGNEIVAVAKYAETLRR